MGFLYIIINETENRAHLLNFVNQISEKKLPKISLKFPGNRHSHDFGLMTND